MSQSLRLLHLGEIDDAFPLLVAGAGPRAFPDELPKGKTANSSGIASSLRSPGAACELVS